MAKGVLMYPLLSPGRRPSLSYYGHRSKGLGFLTVFFPVHIARLRVICHFVGEFAQDLIAFGAFTHPCLHRRIAEAMEGLYWANLEAFLARLAHHLFEAFRAGDVAKALEYAERGGLCGGVPTRPEPTTPRIRFVSLAPHLRSARPSDPTSRRRLGASLVLRLHEYLDGGTFTSEHGSMHGTHAKAQRRER